MVSKKSQAVEASLLNNLRVDQVIAHESDNYFPMVLKALARGSSTLSK